MSINKNKIYIYSNKYNFKLQKKKKLSKILNQCKKSTIKKNIYIEIHTFR